MSLKYCVIFSPAAPSLSASTHLLVIEFMGDTILSDTPPTITCQPSDPRAPVRWRSGMLPYPTVQKSLGISFSPDGLLHSATFPTSYEVIPQGLFNLSCDLVNAELDGNNETSPQTIYVFFTQSKLSCKVKAITYCIAGYFQGVLTYYHELAITINFIQEWHSISNGVCTHIKFLLSISFRNGTVSRMESVPT